MTPQPRSRRTKPAGRRSAQQIIQDLADLADLNHPETGKVNYSAFGRYVGLPVATISRIMRDTPDRTLSAETVAALCRAFQISFAQARGDVPIRRQRGKPTVPTDAELELLRDLRSLPSEEQRTIANHIVTCATLRGRRSGLPSRLGTKRGNHDGHGAA